MKAHLEDHNHPSFTNKLIEESSPYLLEHAHNPVNWYPWGKEALRKAEDQNKPLVISIGYASCHWCHVMERECYSDTEVAAYMNEHFVSIKIDREERPDIDQIYMNASMMLNGSGGWPLNAFTLPDGKPFYVVTYLPKGQWLQLLQQIHSLSENKAEELKTQADTITHGVATHQMFSPPKEGSTQKWEESYDSLYLKIKSTIDFKQGGFNRSPKFPLPVAWEWLLQEYAVNKNEEAFKATATTLRNMALGGIYDQLGGGFSRYSTDGYWFAPHFEKMLYDNGQLISLYAHAYKISKNKLYKDVIEETLDFVERELMNERGGFYSSINADSEGEEGRFYVWSEKEIKELLPKEDVSLILSYYQIRTEGNWEENKNILYPVDIKENFARKEDIEFKKWERILKESRQKLFEARKERVSPTVDDKILVSWNAVMMKGYIDAFQALGKKRYLDVAIENANFLTEKMVEEDGHLWRNYKDGQTNIDGLLEDYALLADAYIALYQVTFNKHWLDLADRLLQYVDAHFKDEDNALFFYTSEKSERLIARKKEVEDNVLPASNSVLATVFYKLGVYLEKEDYQQVAKAMLENVLKEIPTAVPYFAQWAQLLGICCKDRSEIAILGKGTSEIRKRLQREFFPLSFWMGGEKENLPLLEHKLISGKTLIYVCRNKVCRQPVEKIDEAFKELGG